MPLDLLMRTRSCLLPGGWTTWHCVRAQTLAPAADDPLPAFSAREVRGMPGTVAQTEVALRTSGHRHSSVATWMEEPSRGSMMTRNKDALSW